MLDLVHTDINGPNKDVSLEYARYFLSFVDDPSRFCWVYPMTAKSDVFEKFKNWIVFVENQYACGLDEINFDRSFFA